MKFKSNVITLFVVFLNLNFSVIAYSIGLNTIAGNQIDINQEKKRQAENEIRDIQEKPGSFTSYPLNKIENIHEEKGSQIRNIIIKGNEILNYSEVEKLKRKYIGKYGGKNTLNCLKELENLYLDKGYVTTRVKIDMENSDLVNGRIVFVILHGHIEEITINGVNTNWRDKGKIWATLPIARGDIINISDLDQAMDNLNSIKSNKAIINVNPGREIGMSRIDIINEKSTRISGGFGYNNYGQKYTGEYKGRFFLTFEDILGLNDSFTGIYQRKLWKRKNGRNNESFFFKYRVPIGYWELFINRDQSEYNTRVKAYSSSFDFSGDSLNHSIGLQRVIYRDEKGKYTLGGIITTKKTRNYIENIKLESSSRQLTVLNLNFNIQRRLLDGFFYGDINYYHGLTILGADKKLHDDYSPEVEFDKYTVDLNFHKPFAIMSKSRFMYRLSVFAQYTNDILYPSEKLTIGDDVTVRGFKDNSIMGDKGFYVRNEISYKFDHIEPFVGIDFGRVKNKYKETNYREKSSEISGIAIGIRGTYKNVELSCTFSKAMSAPGNIEKDDHVIYFSSSIRF
ncbi:ShlB/FhaC/HecB family hemolysin secretion/activation protein [Fusobacterium sp. PH5-44]|uniref:ShlB/FhaC/HecB family hemolysin secretion/activation protein n=1 Tax=unclassified Fusobacterium TaxID=2648384 RepID=UPI003D216329